MRLYNLYPSFHKEAAVAEHVQDPSGKWVPTPGEGGEERVAGRGPGRAFAKGDLVEFVRGGEPIRGKVVKVTKAGRVLIHARARGGKPGLWSEELDKVKRAP